MPWPGLPRGNLGHLRPPGQYLRPDPSVLANRPRATPVAARGDRRGRWRGTIYRWTQTAFHACEGQCPRSPVGHQDSPRVGTVAERRNKIILRRRQCIASNVISSLLGATPRLGRTTDLGLSPL